MALTRRAANALAAERAQLPGVEPGRTLLEHREDGTARWWTFAGLKANLELAARLAPLREQVTQKDNLAITLSAGVTAEDVHRAIDGETPLGELLDLADEVTGGLKLMECLPERLVAEITLARLADADTVRAVLDAPMDQYGS